MSYLKPAIRVWQTIIRPANASAAYYRKVFKARHITLGVCADAMLDKVDFSEGPRAFHVTQLSIEELGFPKGAMLDELYSKACSSEIGLTKLPAWVPIEARHWHKPPKGVEEDLIAAMDPITVPKMCPALWNIEQRSVKGSWLTAEWAAPIKWKPHYTFLFGILLQ